MRLLLALALLAVAACNADAGGPAVTRTCLASVSYRYAAQDTLDTGGAVVPQGGPLCIEISGDLATITSGEAVFIPVHVASQGGSVSPMYLWPSGARATARIFRDKGQVFFSAQSGNLFWIVLPGMVTTEGAYDVLYMDYSDPDEVFHAEWKP